MGEGKACDGKQQVKPLRMINKRHGIFMQNELHYCSKTHDQSPRISYMSSLWPGQLQVGSYGDEKNMQIKMPKR